MKFTMIFVVRFLYTKRYTCRYTMINYNSIDFNHGLIEILAITALDKAHPQNIADSQKEIDPVITKRRPYLSRTRVSIL